MVAKGRILLTFEPNDHNWIVNGIDSVYRRLPGLLEKYQPTELKIEYVYRAERYYYQSVSWKPLLQIIGSYKKLEKIDCFLNGPSSLTEEEIELCTNIIRTCRIIRWNVGSFDFNPNHFARIMGAIHDSATIVCATIFSAEILNEKTKEIARAAITGHVSLRYLGYFLRDHDYDWIRAILRIAHSKTSRILSRFMIACSRETGIFTRGHRDIIRRLKDYLVSEE